MDTPFTADGARFAGLFTASQPFSGSIAPMSPALARFTRMFVRAALMAAIARVLMRLIVG